MTMTINGSGTITGLSAGGLPDATITQADLATNVAGTGPAFSAYRNASQTIGSTVTTIVFDTELYDTASAYDTATGLFTAPVAGYYIFQGSAGNSTTACVMNQRFKKNGTENYAGNYVTGNVSSVAMSTQLYLAVGDTVAYQVSQTTSQSIATGNGFLFSGCLVRSA